VPKVGGAPATTPWGRAAWPAGVEEMGVMSEGRLRQPEPTKSTLASTACATFPSPSGGNAARALAMLNGAPVTGPAGSPIRR
jgi:hypothetical protein